MGMKEFESKLRYFLIEVPEVIKEVPGIKIFGRTIRSLIFTTDIALIRNTNADAVMAVYPFTTLPAINNTIIQSADMPVFCGVGGVNMPTERLIDLAKNAEFTGATGIVANPQTKNEEISKLQKAVDIPVVVTVVSEKEDIESKLESGADIFNVSAAMNTCKLIEMIKNKYPYVPIIATGGPTDETIMETIRCGADAISFTPPTNAEIFRKQMQIFRERLGE